MISMNDEKQTPVRKRHKVRYAVVGLGHIAQAAILPGFKNASKNSELAALVSDTPEKLGKLCEKYDAKGFTYEQYDELLGSGKIDAVYIALPNTLHKEYAVRAANAGVHVLCEKPMATSSAECEEMIHAAEEHGVRLMVAYRLHFDAANLHAIEIVESGKIGEPRIFNSTFSMQVEEANIRTQKVKGGGPLYDLGVYCINAARYLFRDEPIEVSAFCGSGPDPRFEEIEEMASVTMRFSNDRLASFVCSFGAAATGWYQLVGTKGDICLDPAYEYQEGLNTYLTINDKTKEKSFARHDQFGAELLYFSKCVLEGTEPEPDGWEGLADVRVLEAIFQSAREGQAVMLPQFEKQVRPEPSQKISKPPVREPELVHVENPSAT